MTVYAVQAFYLSFDPFDANVFEAELRFEVDNSITSIDYSIDPGGDSIDFPDI